MISLWQAPRGPLLASLGSTTCKQANKARPKKTKKTPSQPCKRGDSWPRHGLTPTYLLVGVSLSCQPALWVASERIARSACSVPHPQQASGKRTPMLLLLLLL